MAAFKRTARWMFVCLLLVPMLVYLYKQTIKIKERHKHHGTKHDATEHSKRIMRTESVKAYQISTETNQRTVLKRHELESTQTIPNYEMEKILQKYIPMQPADEIDFPATDAHVPRIPHVIHQLWCNDTFPDPYRGYIVSFTKHNPKWQYRFWTIESGRKLLKDRFSYILSIFDMFKRCHVAQLDMIKYAIIYEFGGVYADLDMENIRSLDRATFKYACMIPIKPYEELVMVHQLKNDNFLSFRDYQPSTQLTTDIILCRPKHPFFELLLSNLMSNEIAKVEQEQTIGRYITNTYMAYNGLNSELMKKHYTNNSSNAPYFYQGSRKEDDIDNVYIPNSQYFYDDVDPIYLNKEGNLKNCWKFDEIPRNPHQIKHACAEFERRKTVRKNRKFTFTVHHNHQSELYDFDRWVEAMAKMNITQLVPMCIFYD